MFAELEALVRALVADTRATASPPAALVRKHGLAPMAYTHGLAEFKNDHIMATIRADQQRALAAEAVAAMAARGIPAALLKGISYAGWLYADPGERPMTDVDLLVPRADHPAAVNALAALGYAHAGPAAQRSPRHHAITLKRPSGGAIDLHRSPIQLGRIAIDHEGVWRRARPATWVPGAFALDPVDELLLHAANLARSDLIAPLRSFVDLGRLSARTDRALAHARAAEWRFARVFRLCVAVVDHVVAGGPAPLRWLPQKPEIFRGDLPPRGVQIGRKLRLADSPSALWALTRAVADGVIRAQRPERPA